ncbi:MAG: DUF2189 domain-containing protein [Burkholderiales bacterium]|nr:DUF2189 domain-containing protein [Burkholderiales bacterium]
MPPTAGLAWLAAGWADFRARPLIGLLHGLVMAAFGGFVLVAAHDRFWLLAGAFSGFLLVAPVVAVGLYAISRAREAGQAAGLADVIAVWRSGDRRLMTFGLLLALAGTGWVMTSAAFITLFSSVPVNAPADFLRHVVLGRDWLFEAWLLLGGLLAAPVFASSVIAIPLLLDRPVSVLVAVLTSWRVVLANPVALGIWAALLMLLTLIGMLAALIGLVVVMPVLGHASWHAYRALVPDGTAGEGAR